MSTRLESDGPAGEAPGLFDQLQDEQLRKSLAVHYSRGAFYSGLDLGDTFDISVDRALHLVIINKEWLDGIAERRELTEGTTAEDVQEAIKIVQAGERVSEPNNTRKKIASVALRQELRPPHSGYVWPFSLQRAREFSARRQPA